MSQNAASASIFFRQIEKDDPHLRDGIFWQHFAKLVVLVSADMPVFQQCGDIARLCRGCGCTSLEMAKVTVDPLHQVIDDDQLAGHGRLWPPRDDDWSVRSQERDGVDALLIVGSIGARCCAFRNFRRHAQLAARIHIPALLLTVRAEPRPQSTPVIVEATGDGR